MTRSFIAHAQVNYDIEFVSSSLVPALNSSSSAKQVS